MKKWELQNGGKIYPILSEHSNAYLIALANHLVLVDTGKAKVYGELLQNLERLNFSINDIAHLILTHTHYDHCQSAKKIKDASHCKIIVSKSAAPSIKNGYTTLPKGTLWLTRPIAKLGCMIGKRKFGYEPFEPDTFIYGNYDFSLGTTLINIIETPGHSKDSISIVVDNDIALVGDAMIGNTLIGMLRKPVFPPFSDDIATMVASWGKLLRMTQCHTFLPGHGTEIKREHLQEDFDQYSYHSRRKHSK
jgi:glyoxylase-like metal-dependent hydrolase (beta-lactamase superfamily II)